MQTDGDKRHLLSSSNFTTSFGNSNNCQSSLACFTSHNTFIQIHFPVTFADWFDHEHYPSISTNKTLWPNRQGGKRLLTHGTIKNAGSKPVRGRFHG